ncbi:peptidylprolyl isomerase [Aliikangiella sp. G2MR2-5]|uniref:peptidylprolyl isomerase n=1 Tax=Aliikangiella sp. G2MR2-5 TaxID=2788943 RepID=UPI001AEDC9E6|nr:peptidylprolyl isomerase [Aliikangiella sp. G2MR2-5]
MAENEGEKVQPDNLFPKVLLETNVGNIVVELNRHRAPITSNNFLTYVVSGRYDGTVIHRVVPEFVVQGGGYDILYHPKKQDKPIFNESGNGLKNTAYTIAMAREEDPHSATNQFYFNLADNDNLDPGKSWGYSVFGLVLEGEEVLDTIGRAETHYHTELGWDEVPVKQFVVKKATLINE